MQTGLTVPSRRSRSTRRPVPVHYGQTPLSTLFRWSFQKLNVDAACGSCPLWVKSGHSRRNKACPLYPRKRTCAVQLEMSAIGQKRTSVHLFDYLVGATVEGTLLPKIRLTLRQ